MPPTALLGLENLLVKWLSTEREVLDRVGVKLEDIVGAVVALSVARCVFDASGFVAQVLVGVALKELGRAFWAAAAVAGLKVRRGAIGYT